MGLKMAGSEEDDYYISKNKDAAEADATTAFADAVWIPVIELRGPGEEHMPETKLEYHPDLMYAIPWEKFVLYDACTGEPRVFYEYKGD